MNGSLFPIGDKKLPIEAHPTTPFYNNHTVSSMNNHIFSLLTAILCYGRLQLGHEHAFNST